MNINQLAGWLDDFCYVFLAVNFLWGAYCVILTLARIRRLRFRSQEAQTEFVGILQQHIQRGDVEGATRICEADPRALPQLTLAALTHREMNQEQLRQFIGELMQRDVIGDLEHRASWIATTIKNGPLLGLFGTVLGMMAAFGRIGTGEKVDEAQIADDISIALICTAMGLATAIPLGYFLANIGIKIRALQDSLGSGMLRILDSMKSLTMRSQRIA
jgi:biopolymer transport protein ExbB/TolQ